MTCYQRNSRIFLVCCCLFGIPIMVEPVVEARALNFYLVKLGQMNASVIKNKMKITNKESPMYSYNTNLDCPKRIRLAWKIMPPFIDKKSVGNTSSKSEVVGVFNDILNHAFLICCHPFETNLSYSEGQNTTDSLHRQLYSKEADVILPVQSDDTKLYGGAHYVQVLKSPGLVLIMNREHAQKDDRLKVWNALTGTWTILVPSILLVIIAGICIWALEYHVNQGEFPKEFLKGAGNGIWWSFVSMTTVGYGDKCPRTFFGRFFGMVWIVFGLVVCSLMQASLESALTVTSMDRKIEIFGKKIAVLEETEGYIEAVNQGAIVKLHFTYESAYTSLINNKVFGVLEDVTFGMHHFRLFNDSRLMISRFYKRDISYGLALHKDFPALRVQFLRELFKYQKKGISEILERHYKETKEAIRSIVVQGEENQAVFSLLDYRSPFYMFLMYALMMCLSIMLVGGLFHQFMASSAQKPLEDEERREKAEETTI